MKKDKSNSNRNAELRKMAEKVLVSKKITLEEMSNADVKDLVHELQVHQIELEIQNKELREAQMQIEESRQNYSDLYNFAPVGYVTFDKSGLILETNHTFSTQLGIGKELLMNKNFAQYIVKEDQDIFYLFCKKLFEGKDRDTCELRLKEKGSDRFHAQLDSVFITDKNGKEISRTAVTNTTKRKEAEEKLKILSCGIEQAPTSVMITDHKGKIEYVNPQFTKTTGYSIDEVAGKNPRILKSGKQPYSIYVRLWATISSGNTWKGELLNRKKNGDLIWELLSISPIFDDKGNITHYVGVKIDDTERKRAENALLKSEANLAEAQRIAHIGNTEWEIVNDKVYMSAEVYQIHGITPEKFGNNYEAYKALVHPDDREVYEKSINEALYEHKPYDIEHRIIRPDGVERIVHKHAEVTFDDAGRPIRMFGTVQDITEHKKLEEELLKAQKLESVGLLAGGIAHDFNNILTVILGNTTLAKMFVKPDDKVYECLSKLEKASLRAKDLTQQLLTFSMGGAPIKQTASISVLIKESVDFALRGSNVRCRFSMSDDLWSVEIDEGQVNQVINNLVINAIQAMPSGGIIGVCAENVNEEDSRRIPSLKPGRYIKISFKDRGVGISKEHIADIFDPYFTTKQTGSGLGLASSYSIIKKHDGLITVESDLGVGTTFHIYLPASSKIVTKEKEGENKSITGSGKILIMDDNEEIREMGSQTLRFIGYEVECAEDGVKAIEMYKKAMESGNPFDVVIMDLTIPGGMGGKEAIGKLHGIDPKAKAIVFSGYSNDPIMADYEKYGFKGVIGKPFVIKEMNEALQRVIKG